MIRAAARLVPGLFTVLSVFAPAAGLASAPAASPTPAADAAVLRVGSKRFTESCILGEIVARTAAAAGARVEHRQAMGNTAILHAALLAGAIDLYPEYTGTIAREILKSGERLGLAQLNERLAASGLRASVPLGFSNTYALGLRRAEAERLGVRTLTDLARHPRLRAGFSHEFLGRADGWPGLRAAYGLVPGALKGLDHGLAYEALAAGEVDLIDVYTTDAKIARYGVAVLADDRGYFPAYDAVLLHRADLGTRFPAAMAALARLEGRIDTPTMIALNARAELDRAAFGVVADEFRRAGAAGTAPARRTWLQALFAEDLARLGAQHLWLVAVSTFGAVLLGVPLGVLASKRPRLAPAVLGAAGVVQTIPSLALLAFLIAATGAIGTLPALVALTLYALLPVVRGTHTGLEAVGPGLRQAALALGLSPRDRLRAVELPLALPAIVAGVKTSAVINVGTATVAAFVGAGGFGERIAQGLALNDSAMLLAGAMPAAALALALQLVLDRLERRFAWATRARV